MSKKQPSEVLRDLKVEPPPKLREESRAAMNRMLEAQFSEEKKRIAERRKTLDPVYTELAAVMRTAPEFAGVVRAIDAIDTKHSAVHLPQAKKSALAPTKPLIRLGSIHVVDTLPFPFSWTWQAQEGNNNEFYFPPAADPNTGNMSFGMLPADGTSGQMACAAAIGCSVAIPSSPCVIAVNANPSVNWSYFEYSQYWRQAAGNMWAGLVVELFNGDGSLIDTPVNTQISVASFNDRNLIDSGNNSGSTSAMPLGAGLTIGIPGLPGLGDIGAEGGFLNFWCWIGGSCNADGTNNQSGCNIQMNANCSSLTIDIFDF